MHLHQCHRWEWDGPNTDPCGTLIFERFTNTEKIKNGNNFFGSGYWTFRQFRSWWNVWENIEWENVRLHHPMKQKKNTKFRQWLPYKIVIEKNGSKIRFLHLLWAQAGGNTGCGLRVTGYWLQAAGCGYQVAGFRFLYLWHPSLHGKCWLGAAGNTGYGLLVVSTR